MVLQNSYYFTSKIEIKPQLALVIFATMEDYFTSKIEIKPQLLLFSEFRAVYYFTSKIEIKPQPGQIVSYGTYIILHQR